VSSRQKSQRGFVAVTLITLLAIALVLVVYATLLGTFTGGEVVKGSVQGNVWYSETNSAPWNATLNGVSGSWYAKFNTTGTGYAGNVTAYWQLQKKTDGSWSDVSNANVTTTSFTLTGNAGDTIYATSLGGITGNHDWSTEATTSASYRIKVTIVSKG